VDLHGAADRRDRDRALALAVAMSAAARTPSTTPIRTRPAIPPASIAAANTALRLAATGRTRGRAVRCPRQRVGVVVAAPARGIADHVPPRAETVPHSAQPGMPEALSR
jgi:hypothetical protein